MDTSLRELERAVEAGETGSAERLQAARLRAGVLQRYTVVYESNNSGGRWWLGAEDWRTLETGGWRIGRISVVGNVPASAAKEFIAADREAAETMAIDDWSNLLPRQYASAPGCECCGSPHSFWTVESENYQSDQ